MNDLYTYNLEIENKQLRTALQECRKALEEEIIAKKKAIEILKLCNTKCSKEVIAILGEKNE